MSTSKLTWHGDAIKAKAREAARLAVDETTASCVAPAKDRVRVKTRILQGSIQFRPATEEGSRIVGRWGSFDVNYALVQEILPEPRGRAYLRPAADQEYPKLAARIKARMGGNRGKA
jgi:hypothetical protein